MTSDLERRLAALEAQQRLKALEASPRAILRRASEAEAAGTATLEQYELLHSDEISDLVRAVIALAPALTAAARSGMYVANRWGALALGRHDEIPSWVLEATDLMHDLATSNLKDHAERRNQLLQNFGLYMAEGRSRSAICWLAHVEIENVRLTDHGCGHEHELLADCPEVQVLAEQALYTMSELKELVTACLAIEDWCPFTTRYSSCPNEETQGRLVWDSELGEELISLAAVADLIAEAFERDKRQRLGVKLGQFWSEAVMEAG